MASVEHIDVTVAINHGKGYSDATLVVIIRWREGESCKKDEESFALANAKCTKDNAIILRENFAPRLNERIKKISQATSISVFEGAEEGKVYAVHGGKPRTVGDVSIVVGVKAETWMAGNLSFLPMKVGKEGYAPH